MVQNFANHVGMRKSNRNRIYRLVYDCGQISKPDITQKLGLSLPTVIQNIKDLQNDGLFQEGDVLESTGGRKAIAVSCVKNARYSIGINVTLNNISIVIINLFADVLSSVRLARPFENTANYYLELGNSVDKLITDACIIKENIIGVGFSVPGALSEDGQMLIYSHVLEVSGLHCDTLCRGIPYPGVLCNDANAAGIAELWSRKSISNAVYLSLSNSVGGSIIIDNRLYLGENQRGGEFGHMTLVRDGLPCYCGRKGCMDSYCSAHILSQHTDDDLSVFFERLHNGDRKIVAAWKQYLSYLVTAINNLTVAFDCNIILGGYVGEFLDDYIDDLKQGVAGLSLFPGNEEYIQICKYKRGAAAVGAAILHLRSFLEQI